MYVDREWLRSRVKAGLHRIGWDLVRYVQMPDRSFQVLPYLVAEELREDANFFFLQIGAGDGVFDDPLYELVRQYSLPGLFVEPLPDMFERLKANYAAQPSVAFERCAIARNDGQVTMYRVRAGAPFPPWTQGIASLNRDHLNEARLGAARLGAPDLERYVEEVKVPCLTLHTLLRRHGIQDLTLLQIDAEGFDCQIVHMALDAGLRPQVINYEFVHATPRDRADCKKRLIEAGYSFIDIGKDTLAIHRVGRRFT